MKMPVPVTGIFIISVMINYHTLSGYILKA